MIRVAVLSVLAVAAGCTRAVELDITEGPTRLVIEGRLELVAGDPGRQRIRLSTTDAFATAGLPPAARGATVQVIDEAGRVFPFAEVADRPGLYQADGLIPTKGATYTLSIQYGGEQYRGTDRVWSVAPIDSLYFVYREKSAVSGDSGFRASIDYRDPPAGGNYYLWELLVNDTLRLSPDPGNRFTAISEDRFYNGGQVIGYQPYDEEVVATGARVTMRQVALSEPSFRYYAAIFDQTQGGGPFSVPPASVRGNVANLTNPDHYPLGYFLAAEVAERQAIVPAR